MDANELKALREKLKAKIAARKPKIANAVWKEPRYDDVYFEGLEYLDAIARGEIDG